jgi:hypothetical protein
VLGRDLVQDEAFDGRDALGSAILVAQLDEGHLVADLRSEQDWSGAAVKPVVCKQRRRRN